MSFFIDSITTALISLWSKKVRTALSVLGIVIGILTISGLLTLALGVKKEIIRNIEGLGSNLVAVVPGKIDNGGQINLFAQLGASTLTEEDFHAIKAAAPEARNLSLAMLLSGTVKSGDTTLSSVIIAAGSPGFETTLNLKIDYGRFIREEDEEKKARVVILGAVAAEKLFGGLNSLGKTVEIRGETFEVIGVLQKVATAVSFGGADVNAMVLMPIRTGWEITGTKQIFRIMMQAPDLESVRALQKKVRGIVLENHHGEEDFSVLTQDDLVGLVGGILDILTAMLSALAAISLIVGGIGIMNIMLVSVSERTREIGIRKAVGATRGAILLQFLIESVILTILGGAIAVALFAGAITILAPRSAIPLEINPSVLLLSIAFSIIVGIVFGMLPAYQASRKDPIDALRYE